MNRPPNTIEALYATHDLAEQLMDQQFEAWSLQPNRSVDSLPSGLRQWLAAKLVVALSESEDEGART